MKCPKCEVEMQSGYLQTGNLIAFNKQRHKISLNPKDP
ncbi:MAG: PF20097 family protein, partial [Eubacteriales bacterium]|nr:PF20097 family protein [Eubacteriales bacterium]